MHWMWSWISILTARRIIVRGHGMGQALCLTFDDGPNLKYTPALLDLLAEHQAKATFFLLGQHALAHPELVARILREGHVIGNHSMAHIYPRRVGWRQQLADKEQGDRVLSQFDQRARHIYRPPGGGATLPLILNALAQRQSMALWSIDSQDGSLSTEALIQHLSEYPTRAGDIVLFHDDTQTVIDALRVVLPKWRSAGFDFKVLPVT